MGLRLYQFLNLIASPILFSLVLIRLIRGKESKSRIKERFGRSSIIRPKGKLIWIHATSVGEVVSVLPMLEVLSNDKRFRGTLLLTSTTLGSLRLLEKRKLPKRVVHQLYPIDNLFTVKSFIDFWKPDLSIFIESEFWPCALSGAARVGKVVSLNTAISNRSFKRWLAIKFFVKELLGKIDAFFPQSLTDLQKLEAFGAFKAEHIGNLKYSTPALPYDAKALKKLKVNLQERKIVLFASTHPGEEELAIEVFNELKSRHASLLFILIPRHPTRTKHICTLMKKACLPFALRSESDKIPDDIAFYIVDTIGEVGQFFALSPITVMGGSFVNIGGHNLIEPAKLGSVVISGPYTNNFKDIIDEFKEKKAACFANNGQECADLIEKLWSDRSLLESYQKNAKSLLASKKNILKQVADNLIEYV